MTGVAAWISSPVARRPCPSPWPGRAAVWPCPPPRLDLDERPLLERLAVGAAPELGGRRSMAQGRLGDRLWSGQHAVPNVLPRTDDAGTGGGSGPPPGR